MIRVRVGLACLMIGLSGFTPAMAQESTAKKPAPSGESPALHGYKSAALKPPVNLDTLPAATREMLGKVMKSPTLSAISNAEEFSSSCDVYTWLLDHPDRVCVAWQRLNVAAIDIRSGANGKFSWKDEQGSELSWSTVARTGEGRIWYAEGKVRAGALLPLVPVKAVAILHHSLKITDDGDPLIRHQLEVFLQTDSKAASLVLKILGPAAPRMAQDGAEQMLLFFAGIAGYIDRHPTKLKTLLAEK